MTKWAIGIISLVLALAALVYFLYQKQDYDFDDSLKEYEIVNKWNLPNALEEISGMVWIGENRIACVQDEEAIIFIYDLNTSEIIGKYEFGSPGDYEAIAGLNGEYWVAESGGKLFRIQNLGEDTVEEHELEFEYRHNIEGLTSTKEGKFLISVKDRNLQQGDNSYRGIYEYDPVLRKLSTEPAIKINYDDPAFDVLKTSNPRQLIRPSDLNYHPSTGDLYVLDAEVPKVLVLGSSGQIKQIYLLDPAEFFQPEGICFSPSGRIFISNEGKGGAPNILEVKFN